LETLPQILIRLSQTPTPMQVLRPIKVSTPMGRRHLQMTHTGTRHHQMTPILGSRQIQTRHRLAADLKPYLIEGLRFINVVLVILK
jgi:hypothetical protein